MLSSCTVVCSVYVLKTGMPPNSGDNWGKRLSRAFRIVLRGLGDEAGISGRFSDNRTLPHFADCVDESNLLKIPKPFLSLLQPA